MVKGLAIYLADPRRLEDLGALAASLVDASLPCRVQATPGTEARVLGQTLEGLSPRICQGALKLSHLYFGQEFCGELIPKPAHIQQAKRCARELDLDLVYVSGPTLQRHLAALNAALETFASLGGGEVVVNDLGVLSLVQKWPNLRPCLGRLQVKNKRLPRFSMRRPLPRTRVHGVAPEQILANQSAYYESLPLELPAWQTLLAGLGVERAEVDMTPAVLPMPQTPGISLGAYLPWTCATWGHACTTEQIYHGRLTSFPTETCDRPCRLLDLELSFPHHTWPLVQRGSAVMMSSASRLESACDDPCLDRLIFQPFLPV